MSEALFSSRGESEAGSSSDMWETEVCLINTGDQALSGTLRSYRNNGQAVSSDKAITLAAHGRWSRIVGGGEFTNPSEIGYMVFESASDSVVGYTKFYQEGIYRTAIPAVREVNTSDISYPPHRLRRPMVDRGKPGEHNPDTERTDHHLQQWPEPTDHPRCQRTQGIRHQRACSITNPSRTSNRR